VIPPSWMDKGEVDRARNLCSAISQQGFVRHVIYNSSAAGGKNHGVGPIQQNHDVEQVFREAFENARLRFGFTNLRFHVTYMEELWKKYSRPSILSGKYPLPVHFRRKVYLLSTRDRGRLGGYIIEQHFDVSVSSQEATTICSRRFFDGSSDFQGV
jgi:hypothetical protein